MVAWIQKGEPNAGIRLSTKETPNMWANILADSGYGATFACMTSKCFGVSSHRCRGQSVIEWARVSNVLCTEVCMYEPLAVPSNKRTSRDMCETLAAHSPRRFSPPVTASTGLDLLDGKQFLLGPEGANLMAEARLYKTQEPQLLVRQTKVPQAVLRIMAHKFRRIHERGAFVPSHQAKKVQILSKV